MAVGRGVTAAIPIENLCCSCELTQTRPASRRRDGRLADIPSPSLLKRLLKEEGGAAEWQKSRRLAASARPTAASFSQLPVPDSTAHADAPGCVNYVSEIAAP